MAEIFLPEKIFYGDGSAEKFSQSEFESILIISDKKHAREHELVEKIQENFNKKTPKTELIINQNFDELYSQSIKYISENDVDRIVAVGGAGLIDSAMLMSYQTGIGFAAVPFFSSCAMTNFEDADYKTYRTSPKEVILDSRLAMYISSGTIAYDAMSCLSYALEALVSCENNIVEALALSSAAEILNNIIGAYRGNFKSLEKLQYSMYGAVLAHRNTLSENKSVFDSVADFFSQLNISKQAAAAICVPATADNFRCEIFGELAKQVGLYRSGEDISYSVDRLIERIRKIQAAINIPRCISSICPEQELYSAFWENSHLPSDLLDLCYYGSFRFMKL